MAAQKLGEDMKIIQFQAMPNDAHWQGSILCLCDDGKLYIESIIDGRKQLTELISPSEAVDNKSRLSDLMNHASYSIYENGVEAPNGKRKVIDLEDVIAIIEEEL